MANNAQVTRSSVQRSLSALVLRDFEKGLRVVLQQLVPPKVQPLTPSQTILGKIYIPLLKGVN